MAKSNKDIKKLILNFINLNPLCSSKEIHEDLKNDFAYATIKRAIQLLLAENLITVSGNGKSTKYEISEAYELIRFVDVDEYFQKEIDERDIKNNFNHSLIAETLNKVSVFTNEEINYLNNLQNQYKENTFFKMQNVPQK